MNLAMVAVAAAVYAIDMPYTYEIPDSFSLKQTVPGVRVVVPFGNGDRRTEGVILEVRRGAEKPERAIKPILTILDNEPVLNMTMLRLAAFIRDRYFCTYFEAIRGMLPAGLWFHAKGTLTLTSAGRSAVPESFFHGDQESAEVLEHLQSLGGSTERNHLVRIFGADILERAEKEMHAKGILIVQEDLIRNSCDRTEKIVTLIADDETVSAYINKNRKRAKLQTAVLELLLLLGKSAAKELCYFTGAGNETIRALEKKEFVSLTEQEVFRRPDYVQQANPVKIVLNFEQQAAYDEISKQAKDGDIFLMYGVTGSGKTAVYLRLIEDCISNGKSAMVLVPEISLTPQMMRLFMQQFGDQVAILHSALRLGERYDEWKRIRSGIARVVIGTRSAVFAPLVNPGLIIIDEEHESSYKSENTPRYHAREIAIWRAKREHCPVILGSATPSLESMYRAKSGQYHYVELLERYNGGDLPDVKIIDMREELRKGNSAPISFQLEREISRNLLHSEQSILYLNRRGASRLVLCPSCGNVPTCENCSVSLTYHSANGRLMCHYCGYSIPTDSLCPLCGTPYRRIGVGTQQLQEECAVRWPEARTIRMDADTVSAVNTHDKILSKFQNEQIPILIGTQMVTKGLNFPNVTLVGVIDGDSSLYSGDYRSEEETFDKITQVVGRAGRGAKAGRALLQTMTPENSVIRSAAKQDYFSFYEDEIALRAQRNVPPFRDLFSISFRGAGREETLHCSQTFRAVLQASLKSPNEITILGPVPAQIARIRNQFHFQLTILAENNRNLRSLLSAVLKKLKREKIGRTVFIQIDVNP